MDSKWKKVSVDKSLKEKIYSKNRSFASDVWFRFRHRRSALVGLLLIVLVAIFAFLGPYLTTHTYDRQNLDYANLPPLMTVYSRSDASYYMTINYKLIKLSLKGEIVSIIPKVSENDVKREMVFQDNDTKLIISYLEKPIVITDGSGKKLKVGKTWNKTYILGSDMLGRDIMARLMYGSRISLIVALVAAFINMTIGILYGGISGYIGKNVDLVMMRIVDIISTIPLTLYVILIMVFLDSGFLSIIVALSSVYWVTMARVVRGQIFSLKQQEFVFAAKTIGSSDRTILFKHLLPNAMGPILITATMLIPAAIFMEAFLSFIGLGIAPPMASLGTMCNDSLQTLKSSPYQLFFPAMIICIIMFSFNYVGDGLRDALDPKLKK